MNNLNLNKSAEEIAAVENVYWKTMYESLERLRGNTDFQKLILEGYFKDKAVNGVSMLASPHIVKEGLRPQIMEDLVAVSRLQDFFIVVENLGAVPEESEEDEG